MSASANHLDERTRDAGELLEDIMPSAITLAMMLRHKKWLPGCVLNSMAIRVVTQPLLFARTYRATLSRNPRNMDGFRRP